MAGKELRSRGLPVAPVTCSMTINCGDYVILTLVNGQVLYIANQQQVQSDEIPE
jgi:hypothetical protein